MLGVRPENIPVQKHDWIGPAPSVRTEIPGPNATALLAAGCAVQVGPTIAGSPVVLRRALGSVAEDVDGNRFLDFCAGLTTGLAGHAQPRIVAAIESRMGSGAADGRFLINLDGYHLVEKLSVIVPDAVPYHPVITGQADDAYAIAAKIANAWRGRQCMITFNEFGNLGTARMLCGGDCVRLDWPFAEADLSTLQAQLDRVNVRPREIAAVVVQPLATTRACDALNATFAQELFSFCCDNEILLVFDERVSGMGRTGTWFAFEQLNMTPHVVLATSGLAAGMPIAAVLVTEEVAASVPPETLQVAAVPHPVSCAAALAMIDYALETALPHAQRVGGWLSARLDDVVEENRSVGQARGLGLVHVAEIVNRKTHRPDTKRRDMVLRNCLQRGLLMAPVFEAGIQICPPACVNAPQLEVGITLLEEALGMLP